MILLFLCLYLFAGTSEHVVLSMKNTENNIFVEVRAKKPFIINDAAPWSLELLEYKGIEIIKNKFSKNDFAIKSDNVTVKIGRSNNEKPKLKVKITSFVCTENKSQCFRDSSEEILN